MELVSTNRLRVSLRRYRPEFSERLSDFSAGTYKSGDHGMPRPETNLYLHALGIVAHVKWRPDGKRCASNKGGSRNGE